MTPSTSQSGHSGTSARGVIHTWRQTLIPTTREAPADAESPSHILLSRAGYIRKLGSGIYDYLPLAWRTLRKISQIVREEMDAAGGSELLLPVLLPIELYEGTRRDVDYGPLLFKVEDRKGAVEALGPTHEEPITELMKGAIASYKQLPLNLYQIQTKFRDEARPRSGLLRCREFIMKDAYSFHLNVEGPGGLNEAYDAMYRAYSNIFTRCGLDFTAVEAESGPIGGSASHEFMVNCASGEDTILRCPVSGYAANVEKCEIGERAWSFDSGGGAGELKKHHTPNMPGIDLVAGALGTTAAGMLKTIVFKVTGPAPGNTTPGEHLPTWVLATVRGDHDVNEGKVKSASGCTVTLAPEAEARMAGFAIGYVSPKVITRPGMTEKTAAGLCKTLLLIDPDAAQGQSPAGRGGWATGADEHDHHVTGFLWQRDMGGILKDAACVRVVDIRNALAGDPSPRAKGATLETARGIEVGHIFKLGTKYSDAMGFQVLDKDQKKQSVIMGCYGIGVSRTMAACVEMSHDDNGIIWPAAIAPYHVLITVMKPEAEEQMKAAKQAAADLAAAGLDVLIDDRDERPGVKFKDADLVGMPIRLTVGDKSLAEGAVEFKLRKDAGKGELAKLADVVETCLRALGR